MIREIELEIIIDGKSYIGVLEDNEDQPLDKEADEFRSFINKAGCISLLLENGDWLIMKGAMIERALFFLREKK